MKCKYETTGWYEGMKRCLGTKEVDPCPGYEKCQYFKPFRMTNADRIRAMTDAELADFLTRFVGKCIEQVPPERRVVLHDSFRENTLKVLRQPYGGADHE